MATSKEYRQLGEAAWSWVLDQVREDEGPWFPETVSGDRRDATPAKDRDSLYSGIAGLAPVLAEIAQHRDLNERERALADGIVTRLSAQAKGRVEPSLYDGLAGDATALKLLAPGEESIALRRLDDLTTPDGWKTTVGFEPGSDAPLNDIIMGSAGVVMTAVWAGGEFADAIATTGGEALLRAADRTEAGLDWGIAPTTPSRAPNYSHGTAGVAAALAVAGASLGRADFVEAAVEGARHVLSVGLLDDDGFIVPHTIPPSKREVEPLTYTWCHGPAGTSHLFSALSYAGVTDVAGFPVDELRRRCLTSSSHRGCPNGSAPGSGTTTAAAAERRASATSSWTPRRTARARSCRRRSCWEPARWATLSWSGRSRTRRVPAGGSWSTATTTPCCRPVPRGCRGRRASPPTCCGSPGSSGPARSLLSWTARTSGGPCRPACV